MFLGCPRRWLPFGGYSYLFYDEIKNWTAAQVKILKFKFVSIEYGGQIIIDKWNLPKPRLQSVSLLSSWRN